MFRPELRQSPHDTREYDEAVKSAADSTVQVLVEGIYASQQAGELRLEPTLEMVGLTLWSTMHGLTVIFLDNLMIEKKAVPPEQLMTQVMNVIAQGLVIS